MYKYDYAFKKKIVEIHKQTGKGCRTLSQEYGIATSTLKFWFRLYELYGDEGLADRRGKTKPSEQMSEAEYLRQENKILQAKRQMHSL